MPVIAMDDPYAKTAPYYDLLAISSWQQLAPALTALLTDVDPRGGPLVDLGAGTGRASVVLAEALPGAEVWAVEPSPSMRAILLSHLAWRPDLCDRVTVVAADVAHFTWPAQVAAVVACNMIGHLDVDERMALWHRLADTLAPGGLAIIGLQPPSRPERRDGTDVASVDVGRHRYVGSAAAEPTGPRSMRWTMTYLALDGATVLDEAVNLFDWWTVSLDDVRGEVTQAGLTAEPAEEGLVAIRRQREGGR